MLKQKNHVLHCLTIYEVFSMLLYLPNHVNSKKKSSGFSFCISQYKNKSQGIFNFLLALFIPWGTYTLRPKRSLKFILSILNKFQIPQSQQRDWPCPVYLQREPADLHYQIHGKFYGYYLREGFNKKNPVYGRH